MEPEAGGSRFPHSRTTLLWLCLVPALAAFAGDGDALRSDEVWTLHAIQQSPAAMLAQLEGDVHPPLHYFLLSGWTRLAGTGEYGLRSLSGLLYMAGVMCVYLSARRLFGAGPAGACAAIFAASPLALLSAQLARMYALLAFLAAASCGAWLCWNHGKAKPRGALALYAVANIAGTFTHVWFFFLLFAQCVGQALIFRRQRLRAFFGAMILSLLPYVMLWAPVLARQIRSSARAAAWIPAPGLSSPGTAVFLLGGALWLLAPALLVLGRKQSRRLRLDRDHPAASAAVIFLLVLGVSFVLSFWKPVFWPRFTVVALPALALSAGAMAGGWTRGQLEKVLLVIAVAGVLYSRFTPTTCDARWTAQYLHRAAREGDVVIFTSLSRLPVQHYWDRLQPPGRVQATSFPAEIDRHPGHEGPIHAPDAAGRLVAEASHLLARIHDRLRENPGARVFLLHGFRPATDAILKRMLDSDLQPAPSPPVRCGALRNYIDAITVYQGR